jgi:peptidoglycan-associated lipoprotein
MALLTFASACRKKTPVTAAPPPAHTAAKEVPKPTAPVISEFIVEPGRIEQGQSASLRWQVKDATQIEINQGIGTVTLSGRRQISPRNSTTYTLVAKGPGGSATADTTLNVMLAAAPTPAPTSTTPTVSERLSNEMQDAFFDFDKSNIRPDAQTALSKDAEALKVIMKDFPSTTIIIEGHCDERGSAEYNIGLGDRRASAAKDFLTQLGLSGDRVIKVSYGKERPQCTEPNETCWQKNRRVHIAPGENQKPKATSENQEFAGGLTPPPKTEKADLRQ